MLTSKRLIAHYRTLIYWCGHLENAADCWRTEKDTGIKFTDGERELLYKAAEHLQTAKKIVSDIYARRIGELTVSEVRSAGP